MNYPTNHPFSDRYVSQIPVTSSDLRSAAAIRYARRMREDGPPNASTNVYSAVNTAEGTARQRGTCPLCVKQMNRENRTHRTIDGHRMYVCKTCSSKMPGAKKVAP